MSRKITCDQCEEEVDHRPRDWIVLRTMGITVDCCSWDCVMNLAAGQIAPEEPVGFQPAGPSGLELDQAKLDKIYDGFTANPTRARLHRIDES